MSPERSVFKSVFVFVLNSSIVTLLLPLCDPDAGRESIPIYVANSEKVLLTPTVPLVRFPDNSKVNLSAPLIVISDPFERDNLVAFFEKIESEIIKPSTS